MPHHLAPRTLVHRTKPNSLKQIRERNLCRFKNGKPSSMRNESAYTYFSRPSSGSTQRVHVVEGLERELATSIVASSRTRQAYPQSSTEPAKTLLPPPCFSATCLSHLHPRPAGPVMRFEVSLRLWPSNKPRVPPRGTMGLPQSSL
jgi:hypothetical protein